MSDDVQQMIAENEVKFVDLRFTDTKGKEHHMAVPASVVDEEFLAEGKMFDGSSIAGWKGIQASDMTLMPDETTAVIDPFSEECTLNLRCFVIEPSTLADYERDPRSLAKRAEEYLRSTGIGDEVYFGPEPEFFVFDDVKWHNSMNGAGFSVDSVEGAWNSNRSYEEGNMGHRPANKGGYFPVPPVDLGADMRSAMCMVLEEMGLHIEAHHHEVATGQHEIATRFDTLLKKADELQILKYVIQNVAHAYGKSATFMPKPLVGDNGNGMHCHQSIMKNGENIFVGDDYAGLSSEALYYIGGIIKHARVINAFSNASTNSYKRLVPGFEAPVLLAYSARNRSAAIRIPHTHSPKGRRIEVRFPDPCGNPYLMFSAMLMAGLDGIKNKIHPGEPMDKDLYDLPPEELVDVPTVCGTLAEAIDHLDRDREFLLAGNVFSNDLIDAYINLKRQEIERLSISTHPLEFQMYYSL